MKHLTKDTPQISANAREFEMSKKTFPSPLTLNLAVVVVMFGMSTEAEPLFETPVANTVGNE